MKDNAASAQFPISDPVNLANQPVWMQSGVLDTIVYPPVMDKLYLIYQYFGSDIQYINRLQAEHTFPTDLPQNTHLCNQEVAPHIANCNWDGAGSLLKKVIPNQNVKPMQERSMDWMSKGSFQDFN